MNSISAGNTVFTVHARVSREIFFFEEPDHLTPIPRPKLLFTVKYNVIRKDFMLLNDGITRTLVCTVNEEQTETSFQSDTADFEHDYAPFNITAREFDNLGINEAFQEGVFGIFVNEIKRAVTLASWRRSYMNIPLLVTIERVREITYDENQIVEFYNLTLKTLNNRRLQDLEYQETITGDATNGSVCVICTEEITGVAACTPCEHLFHKDCIVRRLIQRPACPVCHINLQPE